MVGHLIGLMAGRPQALAVSGSYVSEHMEKVVTNDIRDISCHFVLAFAPFPVTNKKRMVGLVLQLYTGVMDFFAYVSTVRLSLDSVFCFAEK